VADPNNPGSFSATAGTVVITTIGAVYGIKYQTANTRWIEFI
jgi:hypothetical protein